MPVKNKILREIKIAAAAIGAGLMLSGLVAAWTYAYSETTQNDIAQNVIRFHVLANSDSQSDQALKIKVRDKVLETFQEDLSASNTVDETKIFLASHINDIKQCAETVVRESGYDYPVDVALATSFFPTKVYGDVVFPPGKYKALRIIIGEGRGQNWWCVMFPPLCYVDATRGLPESGKDQLKAALPEEEYQLLNYAPEDTSVKVKFKIVEWWQNFIQRFKPETPPQTETQMALQ